MSVFNLDIDNDLFALAAEFVNNTARHLFLTGKAGTGKTTFLRYIRENTHKNTVVAAPTGVAAINAGGVTLHSLFQLPLATFIPANIKGFTSIEGAIDMGGLLKQLKLNAEKKELLQEMDLLIIDEVSMLRADTLDAIDTILRSVRKNHYSPYGGVQVLFIGDLYQLPPVVPRDEWKLLKTHYNSPFFFHARVIEQSPPLYIELKKIYRQKDQDFIDILNRVRNNIVLPEDLEKLNRRRISDQASIPPDTITLTTHNRKADDINAEELDKLPGKLYRFEGLIEKDFNENNLPTELVLYLKEGAQVMFIKNDTGENRKYYNGKLATITRISNGEIFLLPFGEDRELKLEKETWQNIRYVYNRHKDKVEEEVLGSFTQYPVRLAWAITIHKSQGLTFERAVIDTGRAFAAGQVYVALSRCIGLEGIYLLSPVFASAIQTDPLVVAFAEKESRADELQQLLSTDKQLFVFTRLRRLFDLNKLETPIATMLETIEERVFADKEKSVSILRNFLQKIQEQQRIAGRFDAELLQLSFVPEQEMDKTLLQQRVSNAIQWFCKSIYESLILPLHQLAGDMQGKSKVRKFADALLQTEDVIWTKLNQLQNARFPEFSHEPAQALYSKKMLPPITIKKRGKPIKGSSHRESLEKFLDGKSIAEIASERGLALSTVEGHLAQFVATGELQPTQLISQKKIDAIMEAIDNDQESSVSIKEKLGADFSYNDIRIVLNYLKRENADANKKESQ